MAEISITQGAVQQPQLTPQAVAPTVDSGNVAELGRNDQVVNVPPRVSEEGNGQTQQGVRQEELLGAPREDNEQASANIVLNRESEEQSVVIRLRYSVAEEQVYLEIVDLDTNATIGRVPRERVQVPTAEVVPTSTDSETDVVAFAQGGSPQFPITDINATLEQFFEQQ